MEALITEFIRLRKELGITQRQLEKLSGVSQPVIARIESGKNTPNINTITKLLTPLGKKLCIVSVNNESA